MRDTTPTSHGMDHHLKHLLDTADAFRTSRILLTAVELDIFSTLSHEQLSATEVALRIKAQPRAMTILMDALVALKLLKKHGRTYANTTVSRRLLDRSSPDYRGAFVEHIARFWEPWGKLTSVIRKGTAAPTGKRSSASEFAWAMYHSGLERAEQVTYQIDLTGVRCALDLGGGPGHYALAIARRCSECKVVVFDRADILDVTREIVASHSDLRQRISTRAGDFLSDDIGSGYDLIIASHIIHAYSEQDVEDIIKRCADALVPGGQVVLHDFFLDDSMTQPVEAALFAVHMLIMTGIGRSYSVSEVSHWLSTAGLRNIRHLQLDEGSSSILIAQKDHL
jgi:SAM-dependent methyltransferase